MTDAVIKGTYSDFRLVRSRKVAQIIIEIPIEAAGDTIAKLGMPLPDQEQWVAVAKLNTVVVQKNERASRAIQQAGIICKEPRFADFLEQHMHMVLAPRDEDSVADCLREICGVQSRTEFHNNPEAVDTFFEIKRTYERWNERQ